LPSLEHKGDVVQTKQRVNVAVLLATYNGSKFVPQQIQSLKDNATPFTLHWLDDHSTDNTRDVVHASARDAGIAIAEWHQPKHLGLPASFFQLIECVEADIYLFCDQDDVWQPGKIDTTVANLIPDIAEPMLCSSDILQFNEDGPVPSLSESIGKKRLLRARNKPRVFLMFLHDLSPALTQGFTRPLRDIFLRHKEIACAYAILHDCWMYDIAIASGTVRVLSDAPTALHRLHSNNASHGYTGYGRSWFTRAWKGAQQFRRHASRHAKGFMLATSTLPPGENLDRLIEIAQIISTVDRRQAPVALARLARFDAMPWWPWWGPHSAAWFSLACLCSDAAPAASTSRRVTFDH
jgi:glycosyltransferase involved in cell wall biosynthesis